jgi:hypothetical protein
VASGKWENRDAGERVLLYTRIGCIATRTARSACNPRMPPRGKCCTFLALIPKTRVTVSNQTTNTNVSICPTEDTILEGFRNNWSISDQCSDLAAKIGLASCRVTELIRGPDGRCGRKTGHFIYIRCAFRKCGARGEIRTRTPVKAEDFESPASTVPPLGQLAPFTGRRKRRQLLKRSLIDSAPRTCRIALFVPIADRAGTIRTVVPTYHG